MSDVRTTIHQDGRELTINRVQDVEPILENNKRLRNEAQDRKSSFRHIASIPNVLLEKWLNEELLRGNRSIRWGSAEFDGLIKRKLRDPEYAYLRTDK
jgi:hypothetical protein